MNLLVMTKVWNETEERFKEKIFKLFDLKNHKTVFEKLITQPALIGRLESGCYTLINGHIYFNNNVIKIRYDLIE